MLTTPVNNLAHNFPTTPLKPVGMFCKRLYNLPNLFSQITFHHIRGHQDTQVALDTLGRPAKLNVQADKLAGNHQRLSSHKNTPAPVIEGTHCHLIYDGQTVASKHRKHIRDHRRTKEFNTITSPTPTLETTTTTARPSSTSNNPTTKVTNQKTNNHHSVRNRWRQGDDMEAEPEREELTVPTPKVCNIYYDTCAAIDQNNWHRQDNLQIERKIETKNWATRVGTTILGMCIVDAWLVYKGATRTSETRSQFYSWLAEQLSYDHGSVTEASPPQLSLTLEQVLVLGPVSKLISLQRNASGR
ncbi:hypothetical protein IV203_021801 [Nitzschia inconspicua]|uniref:Uncharacterized protein n=1 Tax=Nitzschia inconspicua TaxID=303405 RepID=A0A9K3KHE4_9STRA|nr:hypothetical protein IV203_021801 [Nitzschia inconspicua]